MTEPEDPRPPSEWVELWRGPRRAAQLIIRSLRDGGLTSRDQRGLAGFQVKPGDLIVLVATSEQETAHRVLAAMKKNFPEVFNPTPRGKGAE